MAIVGTFGNKHHPLLDGAGTDDGHLLVAATERHGAKVGSMLVGVTVPDS